MKVDTHARARLAVLCRSAPTATGTDGAAITAVTRTLYRTVLNQSDAVFGRAEEEQTTLGEGPSIDAYRDGSPVFATDLAEMSTHRRWPVFATNCLALGIHAVFAFPLRIGAINVGVLTLYAATPTVLEDDAITRALRLSTAASYAMLGLFTDPDSPDGRVDGTGAVDGAQPASGVDGARPPDGAASLDEATLDADDAALHRPEVHQASGMVMIQLGVPIEEALARLRAHSFAEDAPLWEVARAVVAGRLRLADDENEDGRR